VEELREKIRRVIADPSYKQCAKRISEKLQTYGGVEKAANIIEKNLGNF